MRYLFFTCLIILLIQYDSAASRSDSIPELAEILITGKKKKMYIRDDTSFFRVNGFADGTEKTVSDILKKIPGFSIDPGSGTITYQGRTVEKLKIDGADLFGNNYAIGSKNLSAAWIEEIQAIENDPDNPLLKNMTQKGKLVINLRTKKNMAAVNTHATIGCGYRGDSKLATDSKVQTLGLASRIKSFALASHNNRGVNNGAINYFQNNERNDPLNNAAYKVPAITDEGLFTLLTEPERVSINENTLINAGVILQPHGYRQSLRVNTNYSQDRLFSNTNQTNQYNTGILSLVTSDVTTLRRRPSHVEGELEWKQFLTGNLWLNYRSCVQLQKQYNGHSQMMNDSILFFGEKNGRNQLHLHELDVTCRISPQAVFRSSSIMSFYTSNEQMELQSDLLRLSVSGDFTQILESRKKVFQHNASFLLKKGAVTLELAAGIRRSGNMFYSAGYGKNDTAFLSDSVYANLQHTKYTRAHQTASIIHRKGKTIIRSDIHLVLHDIMITALQEKKLQTSCVRPDIFFSVTQNLSDVVKWMNHVNVHHQPVSDIPYFDRPVRISPRLLMVSDVCPQVQRSVSYQSLLLYQDLLRQQSGQVDLLYMLNDRSTAPFWQISDKLIQSRTLVLDLPQTGWHINARFEKFISPLYSNISIEGNWSVSAYYNFFNVKQVRENRSRNSKMLIRMKTALPACLNISYTCSFEQGQIKTGSEKKPGNYWWQQSLNLVWKKGREWYGQISSDWYKPQRESDYTCLFLDAMVSYRPVKKSYGLSLSARNMLNHSFFQQTSIIDYTTISNRISVLPFTLLLEWNYQF